MATFATVEELWIRWPGHPPISDASALALLEDASDIIAALFTIPPSLSDSLSKTLRRVVIAMTRRALTRFGDEGVESVTDSQGPFSTSMKFSNPDGALFITSQEREAIEAVLNPTASDFVVTESSGW